MVDFESLGALLGPGAPDPDLLRFALKLSGQNSMVRYHTYENGANSSKPKTS